MDSRDYAWRWCTTDQVLSIAPCELVYAFLVVSAGSTDTYLYNGQNTSGDLIVALESAAVTGHPFKPREPIYCDKGLFIDVGSNVTGVLVQWRELPGPRAES